MAEDPETPNYGDKKKETNEFESGSKAKDCKLSEICSRVVRSKRNTPRKEIEESP